MKISRLQTFKRGERVGRGQHGDTIHRQDVLWRWIGGITVDHRERHVAKAGGDPLAHCRVAAGMDRDCHLLMLDLKSGHSPREQPTSQTWHRGDPQTPGTE